MTRKRWFLIGALAVAIGGVVAMVVSQTVVNRYSWSQATGRTGRVSYGTTEPTLANSGAGPIDGELHVTTASGSDPDLQVYSETDGFWRSVLYEGGSTSGPIVPTVLREDFAFTMFKALENDETAAVVTDGSVNYLTLYGPGDIDIIGYRLEAPDGPGLAATPAPGSVAGVFTTSGYVDDADNEGVNFTFGAHDNATGLDNGIHFSETNSSSMYCVAKIDIADISDTDDLWFGWELNDATDNPPASADFDTYAGFTLVDNTGDININTALNDAVEGADDTGVDWTDGDQFILRVTIAADSVSFSACLTDACVESDVAAITQTNATLDADDGDVFKCVLGWTNAAVGDPTVTVEYVEIGFAQ